MEVCPVLAGLQVACFFPHWYGSSWSQAVVPGLVRHCACSRTPCRGQREQAPLGKASCCGTRTWRRNASCPNMWHSPAAGELTHRFWWDLGREVWPACQPLQLCMWASGKSRTAPPGSKWPKPVWNDDWGRRSSEVASLACDGGNHCLFSLPTHLGSATLFLAPCFPPSRPSILS